MVEHVFQTDKKVVLCNQRDKVQAELARGGFDADGDIGAAAGDGRSHRDVAVLGRVVMAADELAGQALRRQQMRQQEARARTRLAVDQARRACRVAPFAGQQI